MNEFRRIAVCMYEVSMFLGLAAGLMQHVSSGDYAALAKFGGIGAAFAVAVWLLRTRAGDRYVEIMAQNVWAPTVILTVVSGWAFAENDPVVGFFAMSAAFCLFCCASLGNAGETSN